MILKYKSMRLRMKTTHHFKVLRVFLIKIMQTIEAPPLQDLMAESLANSTLPVLYTILKTQK